MESEQFFPLLIFSVVIGLIVYNYYFSRNARINRRLKKAPWKEIKYVRTGETVKIVGTVVPLEKLLVAPLSKRPCAHYFVKVEEKRSSGKNSHYHTIIEQEITSKFLIQDGEHYAIIDAYHVQSNIMIDANYSSGTFNDATPMLEDFLRQHGHESEGFLGFNKSMNYEEGILEPGEEIAVLGVGQWKSAQEVGLPAKYGHVLVISAADGEHVYVSDNPETTEQNEVRASSKSKELTEETRYFRTPGGSLED
ncbi:MAG: hypothetical protein H6603_06595 [Flavobacteriales bacterium]|nr:hypothetical protein [Flavobacteriales bacterium]MCB9190382.1 hypothetical protein [Flavobacteriales bacterium]MCB9204631.1 hypothetical protein [Flavobacteriales bacterium]